MQAHQTIAFVFLAGTGFGLMLAMAAMWFVSRVTGEPVRQRQPAPVMAGVEVRDSDWASFEAARRAA